MSNPHTIRDYREDVGKKLAEKIAKLQHEAEVTDNVLLHLPQSWKFRGIHIRDLYGVCALVDFDVSSAIEGSIFEQALGVYKALTPARTAKVKDGCFTSVQPLERVEAKEGAVIEEIHPVNLRVDCVVDYPATFRWSFYAQLGNSQGEVPKIIEIQMEAQSSVLVRADYEKKWRDGGVFLEGRRYDINLPNVSEGGSQLCYSAPSSQMPHVLITYPITMAPEDIFKRANRRN